MLPFAIGTDEVGGDMQVRMAGITVTVDQIGLIPKSDPFHISLNHQLHLFGIDLV
ncbi:hypothetical protein D3C85_1616740 [compost metagenome]